MNSRISKETAVGILVTALFLGLVLFTVVLSGMNLFKERGRTVYILFERVGGLRRHDSVVSRGMLVGQIKSLALKENGVLVVAELSTPLKICGGYSVRVVSTSLLGGMHLVIDAGSGNEIVSSPENPLIGLPPDNVMESAGELIADIRASLNEGGIRTNLEHIVGDVRDVVANLKSGKGTVGRLLSDDDSLYMDLSGAVSNINSIAGRIERGEGTVGKLLSDDETPYNDITNLVSNLSQISDRLEGGEGTLGKLLSRDETPYNDATNFVSNLNLLSSRLKDGEGLLGRLLLPEDPMISDVEGAIRDIKTITGRIERGEGLLGQLTREDGEVGVRLNGLLKGGADMLDDMREATPVSTFSSIFFGAL